MNNTSSGTITQTVVIKDTGGVYVSSNVLLFSGGLLIGLMLGVLLSVKFARAIVRIVTPLVPFSGNTQTFQK